MRELLSNTTVGLIEPFDWQELHSPTEEEQVIIKLKDAYRAVRETRRRRLVDARLWNRFSGYEQAAVERINLGFTVITNGVGVRCQRFDRSGGGRDVSEVILVDYSRWNRRCRDQGLSVDMALAVIVQGKNVTQVDHEYRKRRHTARLNLIETLGVYCQLKGWS